MADQHLGFIIYSFLQVSQTKLTLINFTSNYTLNHLNAPGHKIISCCWCLRAVGIQLRSPAAAANAWFLPTPKKHMYTFCCNCFSEQHVNECDHIGEQ